MYDVPLSFSMNQKFSMAAMSHLIANLLAYFFYKQSFVLHSCHIHVKYWHSPISGYRIYPDTQHSRYYRNAGIVTFSKFQYRLGTEVPVLLTTLAHSKIYSPVMKLFRAVDWFNYRQWVVQSFRFVLSV